MTCSSQFRIPGSYIDNPSPPPSSLPHPPPSFSTPQQASSTGVHPGVFRPPTSPSASSSTYLNKSTPTVGFSPHDVYAQASNQAKRKRGGDSDTRDSTPAHDWRFPPSNTWNEKPFSGGRYVLAGQIDTPDTRPDGGEEAAGESVYSDVGYRRGLATGDFDSDAPFGGAQRGTATTGWSLALGAIGGVVGKVWEFCTAGAFRGFYAGGGKGYAFEGSSVAAESAQTLEESADVQAGESSWEKKMREGYTQNPEPADIFSGFDVGGFGGGGYGGRGGGGGGGYASLYTDVPSPDSTPSRPAAKRRQVSDFKNDDLGRNWVIVDDPAPAPSPSSIPTSSRRRTTTNTPLSLRPQARPVSRNGSPSVATGRRINVPVSRLGTFPANTTSPGRRSTASRASLAGPPALSSTQPASFAGQRTSFIPSPSAPPVLSASPSRIPVSARHRRAGSGASGSPRRSTFARELGSPHRNSLAHTLSDPHADSGLGGAGARDGIQASPRLDPEARQLAARKRREERDADARMEAFNARLQDMIRQGKEALGTTVEVEGGDVDGWMDED